MGILVDISDRLYDYTDEEAAAKAVAVYQLQHGLSDEAVLTVWTNPLDPKRVVLEKAIFDAVDANGTVKRAQENIPNGISLALD